MRKIIKLTLISALAGLLLLTGCNSNVINQGNGTNESVSEDV